MRNFEERKAEIFRRSRERILQRRRALKAVSLTCMLLVMVLGASLLLPGISLAKGGMASGSRAPEVQPEAMPAHPTYGHAEQIDSAPIVAIDVSPLNGESAYRIDDPMLLDTIVRLLSVGHGANGSGDVPAPPHGEDSQNGGAAGYQIVLTDEKGGQTVYTLTGSRLTDAATGAARDLDSAALAKLQHLLKLPE